MWGMLNVVFLDSQNTTKEGWSQSPHEPHTGVFACEQDYYSERQKVTLTKQKSEAPGRWASQWSVFCWSMKTWILTPRNYVKAGWKAYITLAWHECVPHACIYTCIYSFCQQVVIASLRQPCVSLRRLCSAGTCQPALDCLKPLHTFLSFVEKWHCDRQDLYQTQMPQRCRDPRASSGSLL